MASARASRHAFSGVAAFVFVVSVAATILWCGSMAILLVLGVMNPGAMAVVAAAITTERLAPARERVARAIGAVIVGAGLLLIASAAGLG